MKKLLMFLLMIIFSLISCKPENPINNELNPFADSTNIKFIYENYESVEVWKEGSTLGGYLQIIDFNYNFKEYKRICGKKPYVDYSYNLKYSDKKDSTILDSLNKVFEKNNFKDFQNSLPNLNDSISDYYFPTPTEIFTWRLTKNNNFQTVRIIDIPGAIIPKDYKTFHKELFTFINLLRGN